MNPESVAFFLMDPESVAFFLMDPESVAFFLMDPESVVFFLIEICHFLFRERVYTGPVGASRGGQGGPGVGGFLQLSWEQCCSCLLQLSQERYPALQSPQNIARQN
jgi:hypothetical protein